MNTTIKTTGNTIHRFLILAVAISLLSLTAMPDPAAARWEDHSDELPGMTSGTTIFLTGLAVAGGITAIYFLTRGSDDEDVETSDEAADGTDADLGSNLSPLASSLTSAPGSFASLAGGSQADLDGTHISVQPLIGFGGQEVFVGFSTRF